MPNETMKQKLMLLLHTSGWNIFSNPVSQNVEQIADFLLENGVIVPPCKVGDTVYKIEDLPDEDFCGKCEEYLEASPGNCSDCCISIDGHIPKECVRIIEITAELRDIYFWLYLKLFGEKVFLTREEADKALQKRGVDNV